MEGNMLYHQYLKKGTEYYQKTYYLEQGNKYKMKDIPESYEVYEEKDSVWAHYHAIGQQLPDQGWKIHVTSSLKESQKVLEKVSQLCFEHNLEFKHLKDRSSYMKLNSKNANRSSSGKFITIYPANEDLFVDMLSLLEAATEEFERGPYILNDKRWKDSNVYYRYGGFKSLLNKQGDYCIRDLEGNLIKDERAPYYQVPKFVENFDDYLNTINISNHQEHNTSRLDDYDIEKALSYSNAGGVYLATRKQDQLKVIIKEARPNAGLDGSQDALGRQKIEYDALKRLSDIPNVVNVIDYFQEWEHYFLIEEFIEGRDLRQWLAQEFPFIKGSKDIVQHARNVRYIVQQVFTLVESMHQKGMAMGDLQPANIMVTDNLDVRIIDFETAMPVTSDKRPSMATTGFVTEEMKISGARDWFGLKRLIRYLVLPVLTSEDLEGYLQYNHLSWIRNHYGEDLYLFIIQAQEKCNRNIKHYQPYNPDVVDIQNRDDDLDLDSILNKLLTGLMRNITNDEKFLNGDIRQYESEGGKFNYLTGGSGGAYVLSQCGVQQKEVDIWIKDHLLNNLNDLNDYGLFTGRAGAWALLYEKGYQNYVLEEVKALIHNLSESNDITLRSGLSGLGLLLISIYLDNQDSTVLTVIDEIEGLIQVNLDKDQIFKSKDWMAVDIGLIDGLSGVSVFYSAYYSLTNNTKYLKKAVDLIEQELNTTNKDELTGVLQTLDGNNRELPYLSGGSVGIALAIWYLNHVADKEYFQDEFAAIMKVSKLRCTISGSLFDGAGGFILIPSMMNDEPERNTVLTEVLSLLNLYLIRKEDYYVYPGQFSYRLSDDVYSGSAGIILALLGVKKRNPLFFLPLIKTDEFLMKTKATNK